MSKLVRYSEWKKPTDEAYAFGLRALQPMARPIGAKVDIRDVVRETLADDETVARFERRVTRWSGPEDAGTSGEQPYRGQQLHVEEHAWSDRLSRADLEPVLEGTIRVMRSAHQTDYVMRDHHMLDVVLYHYATTGVLPSGLFHADRHSDWCQDRYLEARVPDQAATWWSLLEGFKRPGTKEPVLKEASVLFTTAQAERSERTEGRDIGASTRVPGFLDPTELKWPQVLEKSEGLPLDWVSLDLDYFQPAPQLRLVSGLLRDERFLRMMREAAVRVFVLSPQFTHGGDRFEQWEIHGSVASSLRLVNWLRGRGEEARP